MNVAQRRQWREYVYGCPGLTPAQRVILLALADFSDWPSGTNAYPGVNQLAELCGLKGSAVEKALACGRSLKLIQQTQRAKPMRGWAAEYKLLPAPPITHTDVRVTEPVTHTDVRVTDGYNPYEDELLPVRPEAITRTAVQPTKPLTPSPKTPKPKESGASATAPTAELALNEPDEPEPGGPAPQPQTATPAKKRATKTPLPDGWRPTDKQLAALKTKYPELNIAFQLEAFLEKAGALAWKYADWNLAFSVFLRSGGVYTNNRNGNANGNHYANNDDKALGWLTLGNNNTPALPNPFIEGEIIEGEPA